MTRHIYVIGMGAGNPDFFTVQAIKALQSADAVFALDKGEAKDDLLALRRSLLAVHAPTTPLYVLPDPPRDRNPLDYTAEVRRWHGERSRVLSQAIEQHIPDGGSLAFLVWGDPSLYDSTLRVIASLDGDFTQSVIPGITAIQAFTAACGQTVNRIGESIHITTGRLLPSISERDRRNCIVMLDGHDAWNEIPAGEHTMIYWGAYVGTEKEVLRSGFLRDIGTELAQLKKELRARHGWIMDIYLVREEEETPYA